MVGATLLAGTVLAATVLVGASPAAPARPDLTTGSAYLASRLVGGRYYREFGSHADFGETIDGALALAATGDDNRALRGIVTFLDSDGKDGAGQTVSSWTGIGTRDASGGAIGKEALLAEVTGASPRRFGGHDLLAALDASVCPRAGSGGNQRCPGTGSYTYASSVFDQALGVIAQLRAGQRATAPVRYLEHRQNRDGSFPSLIPGSGGDVDSTAMAVMALALAPGSAPAAAVRSGLAWIASRQEHDGGFPGSGGDSANSAGLAIQALTLDRARYRPQLAAAEAFLAREQNPDGGFRAAATGARASNLRASAQALGGATGISFGTLRRHLGSAATRPARACSPTSGVIVAVDFGHWGGPILRACGSVPATGFHLINEGGWHTTGTEHDGPAFVCRISYAGFRHGTAYPTPAEQACVSTPPVNAYWAFWQAGPGQDSWSYSQGGAMSEHPPAGSVELWTYGGTTLSGTSGSAVPAVTPDQLRQRAATPKIVNAPPVARTTTRSGGSSLAPTLIAVAIALVLAGAAVITTRRRRTRRPA